MVGSDVRAFTVPTPGPESDGTLDWDSTTMVLVQVEAGGRTGLGYTYGDAALATLLRETMLPRIDRADALAPQRSTDGLFHAVRNIGRPGAVTMAISAVDVALWDLKARLLGLPLVDLLGSRREAVPAYWSGGFTSSTIGSLRAEFSGARQQGFSRFKMKVGREPSTDAERVREVRAVVGEPAELYVDANGAYAVQQALDLAEQYRRSGVTWFEEPVPAEDLLGLAQVREGLPRGMELATGEYGWDPRYFGRVISGHATDVMQADATRCGGVTGFQAVTALCSAWGIPLSSHTAPALHAHLCAASPEPFRHLEYFSDHVRVEDLIFEGGPRAVDGTVSPDRSRPGLGLTIREKEAERFEVGP
ncbi:MAG: enolase C-terminal domain-like protein [Thermoplasmata archaeon]